ncbi:MAG: response regulator [Saprospiraceae bacterium]
MKLYTSALTACLLVFFTSIAIAASPSVDCSSLNNDARVSCLLQEVSTLVRNGKLQEATPLAFDAMELARKVKQVGPQFQAHLEMGKLYAAKNDQTNAMRQFVQALKIANSEGNTTWTIESKRHIGETFTTLEDYAQAEANLMEALVLAQAEKVWDQAAILHSGLGQVYLQKGIIGKSQEHLKKAIQLFVEQQNFERAAHVSGQLADQYLSSGDYDNAEVYAEQTLQLHTSSDDIVEIAKDNQRLAKIYSAFDDYEGAIDVTERAFGIFKRKNNQLGVIETLKDFALYNQELGNTKEARKNANEAIVMLRKVSGYEGFEIARDLSLFFERDGNFETALSAKQDFVRRREAFFAGEKSRALVELTTRYESEFATEQQQRKIERLETDEATARTKFFGLLFGAGLLAVLAVVLFMSYKRKLADNNLLTEKNDEIGRQKTEIDLKNLELGEKNDNLNGLNTKLVDEMAERESIQKTSFARDRFLATMSHEMRTPINIISGLCHLLLEENPRPDQVEHLRTLQFSANNLVVFINDILDFSKIEAGKLNLEKREFNPKRLFEEVASRFEMAAKTKEIKTTYEFDGAIPGCLMGDPARFNQIMTNLVQTSFAHSVNSKVHIAVSVEELNADHTTLRFQIDDEGQVMDAKQLESMFRSFTYNPDDAFEGYNSSDLVLAITRRLVDLQNGKIEVAPRPEGGNRFTVLLSFKVVSAKDQRKSVGAKRVFDHLAGNSILLVEDNKINQLVVQKMLVRLGIDVVSADDGIEALEILNNRTFDLCLMDIQMPKMDGYRATAEIRKHVNPVVRDIPVIALTASAFLSEREKAKLFGMNDHVGKPFAPEELLEKITNCLAIHRGEMDDPSVVVEEKEVKNT